MNGPCREFEDRIVDYVDGELPEAEAQAVTRHLAACEPCRRTAEALTRSLGLAKVLWSDNLDDRGASTRSAAVPRFHRIRVYAVAASVLIAASVLAFTFSNHFLSRSPVSFDVVEQQVTRAGTAAELLAATRLVAQCEGTESIVEQQYRYILREYADTPAAESIRTQYGSRLGGTQ
jgi:anti-sigma factor RsiW